MSPDRTARRRQLREELRQRRRALPAAARVAAAEQLAERLLALPFAPRSGHVAGYWANDGEIALHAWQRRLPAGCTYCLPVLANGCLQFAPWHPDDRLQPNRFGIPEPDVPASKRLDAADMTLMVLPLVGFGPAGQRLGMGGGWYDRSLAFRHDRPAPPPWLVGAAFDLQRSDTLEAEPWDVPLDAVCTESRTHDFRTET